MPVNVSECPYRVQYHVHYKCCCALNWTSTITTNVSIETQINKESCEGENRAVFLVQVEGNNSCYQYVTVDLQNITGMEIATYRRCYGDCALFKVKLPSEC